MQAVKSQIWTVKKATFKSKVLSRAATEPAKFLLGDLNEFNRLMNLGKRFQFHFIIVQPGLSQVTFAPKLNYILAAADDSISNSGYDPLIVIGT